jgi:myo-inositol-1(or 4)-monophosphatase
MHPMLNMAVRAARKAGDIIIRGVDQRHTLHVDLKGHNDFVTEIDRRAEAAIIDVLLKAYPDHAILAEESNEQNTGKSHFQWVIDPLDGTTNFLRGIPQFAVSIALRYRGVLEQAVVYDPLRQEMFTASRGQGAFLNDRRLRVSQATALQGAMLGTGFPFRGETEIIDVYLKIFKELFPITSGIRRPGSASLDLAYVAAGRYDGFWEFSLKPWDIAAGALLVQEAGGMVSDMQGNGDYLVSGHIVAAAPRLHKPLLQLVQSCIPAGMF